jgi:hypothetical protein
VCTAYTYHKHGEQLGVQNPRLEANVEHDELYQTLATHEGADCPGFVVIESKELGRSRASNELAKESDDDDNKGVTPSLAIPQLSEISLQPREGEVLPKQH